MSHEIKPMCKRCVHFTHECTLPEGEARWTIFGCSRFSVIPVTVTCAYCVNWGAMNDLYPPDYCPVVRKCTRPSDWCCWGARKGESE